MRVTKMQCGLLCFALEPKYAACLILCSLLWIKLDNQQNRLSHVADQGLKHPAATAGNNSGVITLGTVEAKALRIILSSQIPPFKIKFGTVNDSWPRSAATQGRIWVWIMRAKINDWCVTMRETS